MHISVQRVTVHCWGSFPSTAPPTSGAGYLDRRGQLWTLRAPSPAITTAHLAPGMEQWHFDLSSDCTLEQAAQVDFNNLVRVYTLNEINEARERMQVHFGIMAEVVVGVIPIANQHYWGLYVYNIEDGPSETEGVPIQYTTARCSVCRAPQFRSPGGATCANGHGGAPPL